MAKKPRNYNSIPKTIELFGRLIKVSDETGSINSKAFGEARYGSNQIAVSKTVGSNHVTGEELKLTFLHEMFHFILNFTGFEKQFVEKGIDLEQFVELMAVGIFEYEKSAKY